MDSKQFDTLTDKLDKITRLLALLYLKDVEKEQAKVELLDGLGFRPIEIAKLLNKSPENVSVVLSNIRKKKASSPSNTVALPASSATIPTRTEASS
jgi:DNA-directed RNA polymerase specialized sigma24 family protein